MLLTVLSSHMFIVHITDFSKIFLFVCMRYSSMVVSLLLALVPPIRLASMLMYLYKIWGPHMRQSILFVFLSLPCFD